MTTSTKTDELLVALQADIKSLGGTVATLATEATKAAAAGLEAAKASACEMVRDLPETSRQAADSVDRAIKENPYQTAGLAAAAGLLIGALLTRK